MDGYVSKPIDTELLWIELDGVARTAIGPPDEAPFEEPVVMDFAKARLTMDNNRELFEDIVKQFQLDAPPHLKRIHDAQLAGDTETVRRSAHALQGMAGVLAAQGTLHWAREVEASAASDACASAIEHLTTALSRLDDALASYQW
jgi:HPt (histidine-containing phosphotransfer) domain-containing protein